MELEDYIEITVSCRGELQNVNLGCGISYSNNEMPINLDDTDWIWSGITECFWENYHEFEEGIAAAKVAVSTGEKEKLHEALFEIFGEFSVEYYVNGEKVDLAYRIDVEEMIYDLLVENCDT